MTDGIFQRPDEQQIKLFMKKLNNAPFPVTIRWSKGTDIDAGCGQLAIGENLMSAWCGFNKRSSRKTKI